MNKTIKLSDIKTLFETKGLNDVPLYFNRANTVVDPVKLKYIKFTDESEFFVKDVTIEGNFIVINGMDYIDPNYACEGEVRYGTATVDTICDLEGYMSYTVETIVRKNENTNSHEVTGLSIYSYFHYVWGNNKLVANGDDWYSNSSYDDVGVVLDGHKSHQLSPFEIETTPMNLYSEAELISDVVKKIKLKEFINEE